MAESEADYAVPPRRKGAKRERTRQALLEAASALIREQGFEKTSLDAVAARAGMTRGAIYGNFRNREDLFLAVVALRWEPIVPRVRPGATFREQMHALGEAVIAALPERRKSALGAASFQAYALKNETMRQRLVAMNAQIYEQTVRGILAFNKESDLPMPAATLVRVLHALIDGLLMLCFLAPEQITDDVILAAFDALG